MNIQLICVGKLKERFWSEACGEYIKRLGAFCRLQVLELPEQRLPSDPSRAQICAALRREADAIRARLVPGSLLAALCIEGRSCSSEELAGLVRTWQAGRARRIVFLIGGSWGLDDALKGQAGVRLSMSPMTFPHHLARVMLLEQLYRAFQINEGSRYHK